MEKQKQMARCSATTLTGCKCKKTALKEGLCWNHGPKDMNDCGKCLDESLKTSKYNLKLNCNHVFCEDCIYKWLIENPTCPTCREKQPEFLILRAESWGIRTGLLYRPEVIYYNIKSLNNTEIIQMNVFCQTFTSTLTHNDFIKITNSLNTNSIFISIFEKLKNNSHSAYPAIKIAELNPEKLHMFCFF